VSLEIEQVLRYILCHLIPLDVHVLGSKTQGRKELIFYKTENGTSTMKKFVKLNNITFLKCMLMRLYNNDV
jgi:hypothetical protein